jgi:serine/threonine protein kinase/Flp pilus assembly protein TadD
MLGKIISHYEIIELLGHGGMGVVYKALDSRLQRAVAIKMLPSEFASDEIRKKRLMVEARAASALSHPNICTVYEIGEAEGNLFLVMEFLKGHTLSKEIAGRPVELHRALDIAIQIVQALEKAHQHNIIHRDIKPSNIYLTEDCLVKLLDFGLARVVKEMEPDMISKADTATRLTEPGNVAGTVNYMSPEQISGAGGDARSDIFSCGAVLYEMLTGKTPFRGATLFEIASSILRDQPTPVAHFNSNVSPAFERVIDKCIVKNRDLRYRSMADLLADLKLLREGPKLEQDAKPAIAVLYFENLSSNKSDEYFRDGMTEDVITELSKIRNLRVFPRSAILEYRDKPITAPKIAQQLNATHVLTGSVRRSGNRFRITTQLVAGSTGQSIWGERYDRQLQDILDIQDEIARMIASALRIALSPHEERAIAHKPTENTQAYDYYLRGRGYARRCTQPDLEFAIEMYEHAIALDPNFALANAGLANVCGMFYDWHGQDVRWIKRGEAAAKKALTLNPELPEALAALARILWSQHTDYNSVIRYALRAIEQKPETEGAYWTLGQAYFSTDQMEEAAAVAKQAIEATGDDYNVYIPYILALERLGRTYEAHVFKEQQILILKNQVEWVPEDVRARILLAVHHARGGEAEAAIAEVQKAVSLRPDDSAILYNAACVCGILGRKEEALNLLKKAGTAGLSKWDWVRLDPDLACLQHDPEFQSLVREGIDRIKKRAEPDTFSVEGLPDIRGERFH